MDTKEKSSPQSTERKGLTTTASTTEDNRRHMIAEAAYFHAEHRGFQGGDMDQDWFLAEDEIDSMLSKNKPH